MKRTSISAVICIVIGSFLFLSGGAWAAIQLNKEPGGDIYKEGSSSPDNQNGAMVWNGTDWVVNNTWAHTYFTDSGTGQRLILHDPITVASSGNYNGFQVTRNSYGYSIGASGGGGVYQYQAVEYVIVQSSIDGKTVILRSRGSGHGSSQAYFNIYIQDPVAGDGTSALRGDPVWYDYNGMTPQQAVNQTSETSGRAGNLPTTTPPERSRYWLDVHGGSDMGGYSYHLQTEAITSLTRNLGSSFAAAFDLQYYDESTNTVKELRFFPEILSETFQANPQATPVSTMTEWGMMVLLLLLGTGAVYLLRKKSLRSVNLP